MPRRRLEHRSRSRTYRFSLHVRLGLPHRNFRDFWLLLDTFPRSSISRKNSLYLLHHRYRRLRWRFRPNALYGSNDRDDLRPTRFPLGSFSKRDLWCHRNGSSFCWSSTRTNDRGSHHRRDDRSILFGFTNDARCHHCHLHFAAFYPFNDLHREASPPR